MGGGSDDAGAREMASASPRVSVVTPFYNTADYLAECIESVLGQTFGDFEYILVDNHSTDGGGEIAQRFADQDPRITLVRPPSFLSQAANFNYALRQISKASTYCKMVLADDWLYPTCLAEMVAVADSDPAIGLVSSYMIADRTVQGSGLAVDRSVFSGHEIGRLTLLKESFAIGNQSTVMYRSDHVRGSDDFFDERTIFFDTDAALRILADHQFGFVHQVLSFFRIHPGSITDRTRNYTPIAADHMIAVRNHGRQFLPDDERRRRERATTNWFYERLGRQRLRELFGRRSPDFWAYQSRCLEAAGMRLEPWRVWKGAARSIVVTLTSPDRWRSAMHGRKARS